MIGWLILLAYLAVAIFIARKFAWWQDEDWRKDHGEPDAELKIGARVMGIIAGLLWPLILIGALFFYHPPKTAAQLKNEIEERDRRIAELERELGIGGTR